MRYLMNKPKVLVNGDPTEDYKLINGTFTYDEDGATYSTTNATLVIYNTTAGSNTVKIEFEGSCLGNSRNAGAVSIRDALEIARFDAQLITHFETYDYPDVTRDGKITVRDALQVARYAAYLIDEYYQ